MTEQEFVNWLSSVAPEYVCYQVRLEKQGKQERYVVNAAVVGKTFQGDGDTLEQAFDDLSSKVVKDADEAISKLEKLRAGAKREGG